MLPWNGKHAPVCRDLCLTGGKVYQASNRYEDALYAFNVAIEIDDYNSLAHFKKASVLMKLDRLDESLTILNGLQEASPKEAPIYFLMGRIWKKRGMVC